MDLPTGQPTATSAQPLHPALRTAVRSPRRRRPTGAAPPLPYRLQTSGIGWLVAALVLLGLTLAVFARGLRGPAVAVTIIDDEVVQSLAGLVGPGLEPALRGLARIASWWVLYTSYFALFAALLVLRRWRHLLVWWVAVQLGSLVTVALMTIARRPRPFGVDLRASWGGWAMPSVPIAFLTAILMGILYTLVPEGRWRNTGKWVATVLIALVALARIALGVDAPTDVLVGVGVGVTIPLLLFRRFTPNEVFPVAYRRGRSAHLDVGGTRGQAIRRALEDQLGLVVTEVKPFGLSGSAGSTPLRITVKGDPPRQLFGKLYAQSHLRADRWYKLGRELLYGRLEDEKPFNAVRRLVQQEDYALRLMRDHGLPTAVPFGFVELTPEREYLLVTEFFAGATELGEAEVDTQVIDDGLGIIRRLWDAGLAHRDIKPANLLVRDGRLLLIDVFFTEVRPTPWRQAVDLANMMLCLALRSSPELVYERAKRQFTVEEITEGFAAARGLAMPSQLRHLLRAQGPRPARRVRAAAAEPTPADPNPALECPPGRAVGGDPGPAGPGRPEPEVPVRQPGRRPDTADDQGRQLQQYGAAVADGPVGAVGVAGTLHAVPPGRLECGRGGRQQRPVADHPEPRPGRCRRPGGTADRQLRPEQGGGGAFRDSRCAPLSGDRVAHRRVHRHLV
jgi:tRNA A-37 threonylcarbamoyl transferase component Bud32